MPCASCRKPGAKKEDDDDDEPMEEKVKVKEDEGGEDSDDSDENETKKKHRDEAEDMVRKVRYNLENLSPYFDLAISSTSYSSFLPLHGLACSLGHSFGCVSET